MARPITLFTGQWADLPLAQLAPLAKTMGYDGLELACWGDHFNVHCPALQPTPSPPITRALRMVLVAFASSNRRWRPQPASANGHPCPEGRMRSHLQRVGHRRSAQTSLVSSARAAPRSAGDCFAWITNTGISAR